MRLDNTIRTGIYLIFSVILSFAVFGQEMHSATFTLLDTNNDPSNDANPDIWFFDSGGNWFTNYRPEMTLAGNGVYNIKYDTTVMPDGNDYVVRLTCGASPSSTSIYKKITLVDGGSYQMSCGGSDPDIPRFDLNVGYDNSSVYEGYYYGYWLAESSGYDGEMMSLASKVSPDTVTLNKGSQRIHFSDPKIDDQVIDVDGNPITVTIPIIFRASLTTTVEDNGEPVGYTLVEFYLGNSRYDYGWLYNGVLVKNSAFVPGTYVVKVCCPDFNSGCTNDPNYFILTTVNLASGHNSLDIDCSDKHDVALRTVLEDKDGTKTGTSALVLVELCYDASCTSERHVTDMYTDGSGNGVFNLYSGTYNITGGYKGFFGASQLITVPDVSSANIILPAPDKTVTVTVKDNLTNQPLKNAWVTAYMNGGGISSGGTDETGKAALLLYPGKYYIAIDCWQSDYSANQRKSEIVTLNDANPSADLEFTCFGSQIYATIVDEYKDEFGKIKTRPLYLTSYQLANFGGVHLLENGAEVTYSRSKTPFIFNVTPGTYDLNVRIYYTAYPQPTGPCFKDVMTGLCNQFYEITYDGVNAGPGKTAYVTIPFRTWVLTDNDPSNDNGYFPPDVKLTYPVEVTASDFKPSLMLLAVAVISMSLLLASFQARKTRTKGR